MDRFELELDTLEQISQILGSGLNLEALFGQVMNVLRDRLDMGRAALVLRDELGNNLRIVAAVGLSDEEIQRGQYDKGEGVTGLVVASGEPRVIPDIKKEDDFLNRTGGLVYSKSNKSTSFICVPVKSDERVVGALSIIKPFEDTQTLRADARLLTIVAGNIAQAFRSNELIKVEKEHWLEEADQLRQNLRDQYTFDNIIGTSPAMMDVLTMIGQVASSRATVLLMGESGTGKELFAKAIHYNSPRCEKPFVRVNCGAISEHLLESELFGHVKGSFTGAIRDKIGRFEAAHTGTIFLDEIGTLDPQFQIKLLRVLQEREFERVGDHRTQQVDTRVIAATNLDLYDEVQKGNFREDLYYRLNVVAVELPPLRKRREDIPQLIDYFLDKYNTENHRNLSKISRELMNTLLRYPWPGNVRELENAIERAVVMSTSDVFNNGLLPIQIRMFAQQGRDNHTMDSIESLAHKLARQAVDEYAVHEGEIYSLLISEVERHLIQQALQRNNGVKTRSADFLGINRNTLNKKVKELNIATSD